MGATQHGTPLNNKQGGCVARERVVWRRRSSRRRSRRRFSVVRASRRPANSIDRLHEAKGNRVNYEIHVVESEGRGLITPI